MKISLINEKSISKAQQRLMGMVYRYQKEGGKASKKVKDLANSMSKKSVKDLASTKHKNLPEKRNKKKNKKEKD